MIKNKIKNSIKQNYTIIPNDLINDHSLSDRSRFLYCVLASKPDDWEFYNKNLAETLGFSIDTLRKYMDELVQNGWVERVSNKFQGNDYIIHDTKFSVPEKTRHGNFPTPKNSGTDKEGSSTKNNKEKNIKKENDSLVPEKQTPKDFYNYQLMISEGLKFNDEYKRFVDFLYGDNEIEIRLDPILRIPKQVSYTQFVKLLKKSYDKKKKMSGILLKLYNNKKYTDNKRDLYLVLDNWISEAFLK